MKTKLNVKRKRRAARVRAVISGTSARPRLSVFRSNRATYAQLIDDVKGHTLLSLKTGAGKGKVSKVGAALKLGEELGKEAFKKGIKSVVFDRGSYKYHGRVKAVAEGARKNGLKI